MRLLPYHRFEITSPLRREDALAAITAHVESVQRFRFRWPSQNNDELLEGEVMADGFNIRRVMGYRNSFAPAVRGQIESVGAMSRIVVTMRPFAFVIAFCAVWSLLVLSALLTPLLGSRASTRWRRGGFWV